jgi:hypothetical protein
MQPISRVLVAHVTNLTPPGVSATLLAGSTKLLGRADKLQEFVKRGEESGYSEITLATKAGLYKT